MPDEQAVTWSSPTAEKTRAEDESCIANQEQAELMLPLSGDTIT